MIPRRPTVSTTLISLITKPMLWFEKDLTVTSLLCFHTGTHTLYTFCKVAIFSDQWKRWNQLLECISVWMYVRAKCKFDYSVTLLYLGCLRFSFRRWNKCSDASSIECKCQYSRTMQVFTYSTQCMSSATTKYTKNLFIIHKYLNSY